MHLPRGLPLIGAVPSCDELLEMPSSLTFFPMDSFSTLEDGARPSCVCSAWCSAFSPLSAIPSCTRSFDAVRRSAALQENPLCKRFTQLLCIVRVSMLTHTLRQQRTPSARKLWTIAPVARASRYPAALQRAFSGDSYILGSFCTTARARSLMLGLERPVEKLPEA